MVQKYLVDFSFEYKQFDECWRMLNSLFNNSDRPVVIPLEVVVLTQVVVQP